MATAKSDTNLLLTTDGPLMRHLALALVGQAETPTAPDLSAEKKESAGTTATPGAEKPGAVTAKMAGGPGEIDTPPVNRELPVHRKAEGQGPLGGQNQN
jgi:hypothetical protein